MTPARPLPRPPRGHRAVDRRRCGSARSTATRSSPTRAPLDLAGFLAAGRGDRGQFDALVRAVPPTRWTTPRLTPGWTLRDHVGHLADWAEEGVRAIDVFDATGPLAGRSRGGHRRLERADASRAARPASAPGRAAVGSLATTDGPAPCWLLEARARRLIASTTCARPTAGAGPTTACTATSASTSRCSARGARRGRLATGPDRPADDAARRAAADRRAAGLTIEAIVAVDVAARVPAPPPRPGRRLHRRGGRRAPAVHALARGGGPSRPSSPRRRSRSATRSGRPTVGGSPSSATTRSGSSRPTGRA